MTTIYNGQADNSLYLSKYINHILTTICRSLKTTEV